MVYLNKIIKPLEINNLNIYNVYSKKKPRITLETSFATTKDERRLKLSNTYNFMFDSFSQKPILKSVKTYNIKKKIVKQFNFFLSLSKTNKELWYNYFIYYNHFYHIYFSKNIKHDKRHEFYRVIIENLQLFFSENDLKQKTKLYISFYQNGTNKEFLTKNMNLRRCGI